VEIHAGNFGDDQLRIEVKDNGVGIDPQVLPQIFDAFEQGSAGVTREFGGLGLGLAITKALVEMHRGSIKAESAGAGQGATFTVWLPRGLPEHLPAKDPPTSRRISDEASLRLLVVEDHADTARTLGLLLRRAGFDVVTAPDVAGALERMQQQEFDVLVSDLGLPDGTGYDLMRAVRQRTTIPGIAMSGYGMEEDLRRSQEAGFVEHLVKPVSIAKLQEAIHRLRLTR
jgi:CheY-like chemotaxis protein